MFYFTDSGKAALSGQEVKFAYNLYIRHFLLTSLHYIMSSFCLRVLVSRDVVSRRNPDLLASL